MPTIVESTTPAEEKDEWRTPPEFFKLLDLEFHFNLDAAATKENALAKRYFTKEDNSLEQDWYRPDLGVSRVFCNPPFSNTQAFLEKGVEEFKKGASVIVFLVRADGYETKWFTRPLLEEPGHLLLARTTLRAISTPLRFVHIRQLVPRVHYRKPDGTKSEKGSQFPSALVIMSKNHPSGVYWWYWKLELKGKGLFDEK